MTNTLIIRKILRAMAMDLTMVRVSYVFQHLNSNNPETNSTDLKISEAMAKYWTNFAKYGHPNGNGVPAWPAFSDTRPVVMYFNKTPHTGPVPDVESLKVLDAYFRWRRTPEGLGLNN